LRLQGSHLAAVLRRVMSASTERCARAAAAGKDGSAPCACCACAAPPPPGDREHDGRVHLELLPGCLMFQTVNPARGSLPLVPAGDNVTLARPELLCRLEEVGRALAAALVARVPVPAAAALAKPVFAVLALADDADADALVQEHGQLCSRRAGVGALRRGFLDGGHAAGRDVIAAFRPPLAAKLLQQQLVTAGNSWPAF
jgi:hypothetical protein